MPMPFSVFSSPEREGTWRRKLLRWRLSVEGRRRRKWKAVWWWLGVEEKKRRAEGRRRPYPKPSMCGMPATAHLHTCDHIFLAACKTPYHPIVFCPTPTQHHTTHLAPILSPTYKHSLHSIVPGSALPSQFPYLPLLSFLPPCLQHTIPSSTLTCFFPPTATEKETGFLVWTRQDILWWTWLQQHFPHGARMSDALPVCAFHAQTYHYLPHACSDTSLYNLPLPHPSSYSRCSYSQVCQYPPASCIPPVHPILPSYCISFWLFNLSATIPTTFCLYPSHPFVL